MTYKKVKIKTQIKEPKILFYLRLLNIFNFFLSLNLTIFSMRFGNNKLTILLFFLTVFYFYMAYYTIKVDFLDKKHGR